MSMSRLKEIFKDNYRVYYFTGKTYQYRNITKNGNLSTLKPVKSIDVINNILRTKIK